MVFVQIGSNDGVQGDPICDLARDRGWSGILVEPVPFLVERLKKTYGNQEKFKIYNVAVADSPGKRPFYYLDQGAGPTLGLPYWYDQLGSFNRDHILKHFRCSVEDFIRMDMVECMTFEQILDDSGLETFDVLHIDTEGFDYKVLEQIDFDRVRPAVIIYEHKHLTPGEKKDAAHRLRSNHYKVETVGHDCLCVLDHRQGGVSRITARDGGPARPL